MNTGKTNEIACYQNSGSQQESAFPSVFSKKEIKPSQSTLDKAKLFKTYVERKLIRKKPEVEETRNAWVRLNKKMEELNLSTTEQQNIKQDIMKSCLLLSIANTYLCEEF